MSFVQIGNRIINLTMVIRADYLEADDRTHADDMPELVLVLADNAEFPLRFFGDEATAVWGKLCKAACPLERL